MPKLKDRSTWWGEYAFACEDAVQWQIGPLLLKARRKQQEWQISYQQLTTDQEQADSWSVDAVESLDPGQDDLQRHVFTRTEEPFVLTPLMADRSVVIKSAVPVHVQVGQEINFFVSTPLWVTAQVHSELIPLFDLPVSRPSDTWFGSSTLLGELCYASTTQGRLYLDDLPVRPQRAISPVLIKNLGKSPLLLNKLSLPVPNLSLFDTQVHGLWTEAVTIIKEDESEFARITVADSPPEPYSQALKVSEARKKAETNMLTRTFSALFS